MFLSLFVKIVVCVGFSSVWLFILPSRVVVTGSGLEGAYDVIRLYCDEDYGVYFTKCTVKYYYEDNILTRIINATERPVLWDDNTASSGPRISADTKSIVFEFEFVEEWYFKDIGIWFEDINDTLIDSMYWQYKDINSTSGEIIKNMPSKYLGYSYRNYTNPGDGSRVSNLGLYYEYSNTTSLELARNNKVLTKSILITLVFEEPLDDDIYGRLTEIEIGGYNNDTYYLIPTGSTTPNPTPSPTDLINYTCIENKNFIISYTISLDNNNNNNNTYSFSNDARLFDYGFPINFEGVREMIINVTFDYNDDYYTNFWRFYGLKDIILNHLNAAININMTTGAFDVTLNDKWFMETYFERYNENGLSLVVTNGTMTDFSYIFNITTNTYNTRGELSFFIDSNRTMEYARPKYFLIYYYGFADSDDFGPMGEIDLRCFRNLYSTTTPPITTTTTTTATGTPIATTSTGGSTTSTSTSTSTIASSTRTSLSSSVFTTENTYNSNSDSGSDSGNDSGNDSDSDIYSNGSTVNNICFPLSVFLCFFFGFYNYMLFF